MTDWKGIQIPYDPVAAASDVPVGYSLTDRDILVLLALSGQAHWVTRWYKVGGLTELEKEDTEDWASHAESALLNPAVSTPEPPYWDGTNGENADNEHPTDTGSPWYEDLAWEFVEGFVAILVGPPAAHIYITVTKKLRIAYLKRDFGGIFNVEIDGSAVASVDTYSATEEIAYVDVVIP